MAELKLRNICLLSVPFIQHNAAGNEPKHIIVKLENYKKSTFSPKKSDFSLKKPS